MLTSDALRIFKDQYESDTAAEKDAVFRVKLGPLTLGFPNPGGLKAHDLHHVVLGATPTFWGEVWLGKSYGAFARWESPSRAVTSWGRHVGDLDRAGAGLLAGDLECPRRFDAGSACVRRIETDTRA